MLIQSFRDLPNYPGPYLIYLLTAVGLTPGGSSTVHIYTRTIHSTTQLTTSVGRLSGIRTQSGQTKIKFLLSRPIKMSFAAHKLSIAVSGKCREH